jgi:hypothetical protein
MQSKPLTKEDVAKINNFSTRLVPLKTYREGKKMQEEVTQQTTELVPERAELKDVDDTALVRNTLEDLILTHKKKKSLK